MKEIVSDLVTMPKLRERSVIKLVTPSGEVFHSSTKPMNTVFISVQCGDGLNRMKQEYHLRQIPLMV